MVFGANMLRTIYFERSCGVGVRTCFWLFIFRGNEKTLAAVPYASQQRKDVGREDRRNKTPGPSLIPASAIRKGDMNVLNKSNGPRITAMGTVRNSRSAHRALSVGDLLLISSRYSE